VIFGPQKLHKNFMKCPSEEFFEELKIRNALSLLSASKSEAANSSVRS